MADEKELDMASAGDPVPARSGKWDDALNDPEMEGLTLYEKKALLVNLELNGHGMGKKYLSPCHPLPHLLFCHTHCLDAVNHRGLAWDLGLLFNASMLTLHLS